MLTLLECTLSAPLVLGEWGGGAYLGTNGISSQDLFGCALNGLDGYGTELSDHSSDCPGSSCQLIIVVRCWLLLVD